MTQLEAAKKNIITEKMAAVAKAEGLAPEAIRDEIARGAVVIPSNIGRVIPAYCGIGRGLKTKVNANIGSSLGREDIKLEIKKLRMAVEAGSDTVMDLSTGPRLKEIRRLVLKESAVPVGTVPVYEMAADTTVPEKGIVALEKNDVLSCLEGQAKEGVDFFTIHCGVTRKALEILRAEGRVLGVVSRGGALTSRWMAETGEENPFYEHYDDILAIAKRYDVTLSLGDGLRPGCIEDATDKAQITELITLGELAKKANERGVQVMIEGPGHIPIHQIKRNIELEKDLCNNAPFYVLGPIVTDIAPGYDHITAAIGGALAASFGADFLCYVTASEHLRLPTPEDVREGVIAAKIAAHAADISKGVKGAADMDKALSSARKKRDWNEQIRLAIDPKKAAAYRKDSSLLPGEACTMCDKYCSIKLFEEAQRH